MKTCYIAQMSLVPHSSAGVRTSLIFEKKSATDYDF